MSRDGPRITVGNRTVYLVDGVEFRDRGEAERQARRNALCHLFDRDPRCDIIGSCERAAAADAVVQLWDEVLRIMHEQPALVREEDPLPSCSAPKA